MLIVLLLQIKVVFHLLTSPKLFQHNHFVATVLRRLGKQRRFLLVLSRVYDVSPFLFVLGLEVSQELVKRLITLCHRANRCVQRFSWSLLLCFNKPLQLLDFLNSFWSTGSLFAASVATVGEEKHLVFVVLIGVVVEHHL